MTVAYASGMESRLGIDSANPVTHQFDFLRCNIGMAEEFLDGNGLRGTRQHDISRNRAGIQRVGGHLAMQPNGAELALLLPWIMSGSPSGSGTVTYPLAETVATRYIAIDRNASNLATYAGCGIDTATFHADKGQILGLDLDVIGQTETISGSFPGGLSIDTENGPWIITDIVFSVNSTTVNVDRFTLSLNNHIDRERFNNSLTLTNIVGVDQTVSFDTTMPFGAYYALYGTGQGGVALSITATNGGAVLTITGGKVALPRISPEVAGRSEVLLPLRGQVMADKTNTLPSLSISLNPGP